MAARAECEKGASKHISWFSPTFSGAMVNPTVL